MQNTTLHTGSSNCTPCTKIVLNDMVTCSCIHITLTLNSNASSSRLKTTFSVQAVTTVQYIPYAKLVLEKYLIAVMD